MAQSSAASWGCEAVTAVQALRSCVEVTWRCREQQAKHSSLKVGMVLQLGGAALLRCGAGAYQSSGSDQARCREMEMQSSPITVALQGCFPGLAPGFREQSGRGLGAPGAASLVLCPQELPWVTGSTVLVPVAFLDTGALEIPISLDPGGLFALT